MILINVFLAVIFSAVSSAPANSTEVFHNIRTFQTVATPQIYPATSFTHKFIRDPYYVLQWLSASNFNIENAIKNFMAHLKWRQAEKIDTIHLENWELFSVEYPQFVNLSNKTNDVVVEVWLNEWDFRKAIVRGHRKMLNRWQLYVIEMAQRNLCETRSVNKRKGRLIVVLDVDGWQQNCKICINYLTNYADICEKQYPGIMDKVYLINTEPVLHQLITTFGATSSLLAKGVTKVYTNQRKWMPVFDKQISKQQRSVRYGGALSRNS